MFERIKNPKARRANIILAVVYIAVIATLFALALAGGRQKASDASSQPAKITF